MRESVSICKQRDEKLVIVEEKVMSTSLNENTMEITTSYEGELYAVKGNIYFLYIVIE